MKILKSERGIIARLSKDLGIDQFNLYRWKDGKGAPSGDDMIKLYEFVKNEMGEGTAQEKIEVPVKYISLLETQLNTLNRTNEALVMAINMLSSSSAGDSTSHTQESQTSGRTNARHTEQAGSTAEDVKLAAHLDEHTQRTNESLKKAKPRHKAG